MVIYLDTETTGLRPGNICQLSYVIQRGTAIKSKNFFFTVDYVEYGALSVHGFSVPLLKSLSGGKRFADFIDEIEEDFEVADLIVAHNSSFDFGFLRAEFERVDRFFNSEKGFCTMKNSISFCKLSRSNHARYKYPRLSELCACLGICDAEILKFARQTFGVDCGYHDARFDTSALFLASNKGINCVESFKKIKEFI